MEFFDNQVAEVRYLTQVVGDLGETPAPASPASSSVGNPSAARNTQLPPLLHQDPRLRASTSTPSIDTNTNGAHGGTGTKRKASIEDATNEKGTPQQRSKRNRYISIACNECKRRKIKCNGASPCERCGNLNLACVYAPNCCSNSVKDSDEFKDMTNRVALLQEQVDTLFNDMNALRSEALQWAPIQNRPPPLPTAAGTPSNSSISPVPPGFRGPTSTRFSLDVAKTTLHRMGYGSPGEAMDGDGAAQVSPVEYPRVLPQIPSLSQTLSSDPLWEFDKDELVRLCRVYEEEINLMFPVLRIETVISHAINLGAWMEAAKRNHLVAPLGEEGGIKDPQTLLLKAVLANALVVEEHGNSEKALRIYESYRAISDKMMNSDPSNAKNLPILALTAAYHFFAADEIISWRGMGQVARHCFELGYHRRDVIEKIQDREERDKVINTFWSIFILDRRWAFSTGLPYVIPDEEVDPQMPYPDSHPFLVAMISYSRISAKVWRFVRHLEPGPTSSMRAQDIEDLDRQIKQWYAEVPEEVKLEFSDWEALPQHLSPQVNSQKEYDIQRLQIWTYLRFNQIRTWLYTPILHTHSSIMEHFRYAECVVKLARNTIRYLTHLNNTTNIYRKMQIFYHQFLSSAIAVLFLASCHAPVNFSSVCRDEFYMALELVKDLSSKSWVSKRLWSTIRSLREVAPRLGLAEDPHSTAALTMAGLATGQMGQPASSAAAASVTPANASSSNLSPFMIPVTSSASTPGARDAGQNGVQMSNEMSRLFEGYTSVSVGGGVGVGVLADHQHHGPPSQTTAPEMRRPGGNNNNNNNNNGAAQQQQQQQVDEITGIYQHFRELF